jgi:hypothetical protein
MRGKEKGWALVRMKMVVCMDIIVEVKSGQLVPYQIVFQYCVVPSKE